jgi:hypothetical protein
MVMGTYSTDMEHPYNELADMSLLWKQGISRRKNKNLLETR